MKDITSSKIQAQANIIIECVEIMHDARLEFAKRMAEFKKSCKEEGISFKEGIEKYIRPALERLSKKRNISYKYACELAKIGELPEEEALKQIENHRNSTKKRVEKSRQKKTTLLNNNSNSISIDSNSNLTLNEVRKLYISLIEKGNEEEELNRFREELYYSMNS